MTDLSGVTGTFDNRATMARELWENGRLLSWVSAHALASKSYLRYTSKPWGGYPDLPDTVDSTNPQNH